MASSAADSAAAAAPAAAAPRVRGRPASLSAPSARELEVLGLGPAARASSAARGSTFALTLLQPLVALEEPQSPSPGAGSGQSTPVFYSGPLPPPVAAVAPPLRAPAEPASREVSRLALSFVGGGMLPSISSSRLELPVLSTPSPRGDGGAGGGDGDGDKDGLRLLPAGASAAEARRQQRAGGRGGGCGCLHLSAINEYAVRFGTHIAILSIFENLFFWYVVGPTEDAALFGVLNRYLSGTLNSCGSWNATQRDVLALFFGLLLNKTAVDAQGAAVAASRGVCACRRAPPRPPPPRAGLCAASPRHPARPQSPSHSAADNGVLRRNSWLYVFGLFSLLAMLIGQTLARRKQLNWWAIAGENLTMILLLGACACIGGGGPAAASRAPSSARARARAQSPPSFPRPTAGPLLPSLQTSSCSSRLSFCRFRASPWTSSTASLSTNFRAAALMARGGST
jgi:hypothetical protein